MKGLALELGGDPETWEIVGLLHDADYEKTKDTPEQHTVLMAEILRDEGVDESIIRAIQSHNYEYTGLIPESVMEYALLSCDDLTGLIVAVALVNPEKLTGVMVKSVLKKFSSKTFAAGADREKIRRCEENLDLPLEVFIDLVLQAMKEEVALLGLES
jgi:putative nucleotidyltransferase with HDIG domain